MVLLPAAVCLQALAECGVVRRSCRKALCGGGRIADGALPAAVRIWYIRGVAGSRAVVMLLLRACRRECVLRH